MSHHTSAVRTVVSFEPPVMRHLPDGQVWLDLDVGCGTGAHVLLCAARGLDATGIDIAAAPFDTVLDCGLCHVFGEPGRAAYADAIRSVLVPGGRYCLLCFSDREPGDQGPRRLTRDDLTATFTDGWRLDSIERTTLDSRAGPDGIHARPVALAREE